METWLPIGKISQCVGVGTEWQSIGEAYMHAWMYRLTSDNSP